MMMQIWSKSDHLKATITTPKFESFIKEIQWNDEQSIQIPSADLAETTVQLSSLIIPSFLRQTNERNEILFEAGIILSHISLIATIPRNKSLIREVIFDEFHTPKNQSPGVVPQIYFLPADLSANQLLCSSLVSKGALRRVAFFGWAAEEVNYYTPLSISEVNFENKEQKLIESIRQSARNRAIRWSNGAR